MPEIGMGESLAGCSGNHRQRSPPGYVRIIVQSQILQPHVARSADAKFYLFLRCLALILSAKGVSPEHFLVGGADLVKLFPRHQRGFVHFREYS